MAAQFHAQIMIPHLCVAVNFVKRSSIRPGRFRRFNTFIEECRHAEGVTYGRRANRKPRTCTGAVGASKCASAQRASSRRRRDLWAVDEMPGRKGILSSLRPGVPALKNPPRPGGETASGQMKMICAPSVMSMKSLAVTMSITPSTKSSFFSPIMSTDILHA